MSLAGDIDAYGQAVGSCPANARAKPVGQIAGDGDNKAGSPGRSRSSRKAIAQGVPGDFGVPVLAWRAFVSFARKAMGASCTRHSLLPRFRGTMFWDHSDAIAPRECGGVP